MQTTVIYNLARVIVSSIFRYLWLSLNFVALKTEKRVLAPIIAVNISGQGIRRLALKFLFGKLVHSEAWTGYKVTMTTIKFP